MVALKSGWIRGGERVCMAGQSRGEKGLRNNGLLLMMTNTVDSSFLKCSICHIEVGDLMMFPELGAKSRKKLVSKCFF